MAVKLDAILKIYGHGKLWHENLFHVTIYIRYIDTYFSKLPWIFGHMDIWLFHVYRCVHYLKLRCHVMWRDVMRCICVAKAVDIFASLSYIWHFLAYIHTEKKFACVRFFFCFSLVVLLPKNFVSFLPWM